MMSEAARELLDALAPMGAPERETRLRGAGSGLEAGEVDEVRALLRALDASPGFLEGTTLAWGDDNAETPVVAAPVGAGARLGLFTLLREVGRGGMGVVYEAEQDRPRRRVALKVMKPGPHARSDLARFEREAEALGRLNHPNIAAVYEARMLERDGSGEQTPYIAMEFVRGRSIVEHARERGLNARAVIELMATACEAVAYAHAVGVVHRDLSPTNLLVDEAGVLKVVDFGVARLSEGDPQAAGATTGRHVVGKWAYMSPEQASGDPAGVDHRTDVFALGATLYELLAGRPWLDIRQRSVMQLLRAVTHEAPVPIGEALRDARGDLQAIVTTAMAKDRARRYGTVAELRDDLRRWLDGQPVKAREPGAIERLARFAGQNRALVGFAATAFVALSVGLAAATSQWVRATRSEARLQQTVRGVLEGVVRGMSRTRYSIDIRAGALREIKPAIDRLIQDSPDDPRNLALAAKYYMQLAEVQGYYYTPNRGDRDAAIASYRSAIGFVAPAGLDAVSDEECAATAVQAWNMLEETLRLAGRLTEGDADAPRALRATEAWLARTGDRPRWLHLRAWTLCNLGSRHQGADAERVRTEVDELRRELLAASVDGAPVGVAKNLGNAWLSLGRGGFHLDEFELGADACARARPLLRRWAESPDVGAAEADPDDWLNYLDTYRYEARCLAGLNRLAEAVGRADAAVGLAREFITRFPERQNVTIALKSALVERAEVRAMDGDVGAIDDCEEAVAITESLSEEEGSEDQHAIRTCSAYLALADVADTLVDLGLTSDGRGRDLLALIGTSLDAVEAGLRNLAPELVADDLRRGVARLRSKRR